MTMYVMGANDACFMDIISVDVTSWKGAPDGAPPYAGVMPGAMGDAWTGTRDGANVDSMLADDNDMRLD
jgi:hypothetical protein